MPPETALIGDIFSKANAPPVSYLVVGVSVLTTQTEKALDYSNSLRTRYGVHKNIANTNRETSIGILINDAGMAGHRNLQGTRRHSNMNAFPAWFVSKFEKTSGSVKQAANLATLL